MRLILHHDVDGDTSNSFIEFTRWRMMQSYDLHRGDVDGGIDIVRTTSTYDAAECSLHRAGVDCSGNIQVVYRARVTVAPCRDIDTVDVLQYSTMPT